MVLDMITENVKNSPQDCATSELEPLFEITKDLAQGKVPNFAQDLEVKDKAFATHLFMCFAKQSVASFLQIVLTCLSQARPVASHIILPFLEYVREAKMQTDFVSFQAFSGHYLKIEQAQVVCSIHQTDSCLFFPNK